MPCIQNSRFCCDDFFFPIFCLIICYISGHLCTCQIPFDNNSALLCFISCVNLFIYLLVGLIGLNKYCFLWNLHIQFVLNFYAISNPLGNPYFMFFFQTLFGLKRMTCYTLVKFSLKIQHNLFRDLYMHIHHSNMFPQWCCLIKIYHDEHIF